MGCLAVSGDKVEIDMVVEGNIGHFNGMVEQGDASVSIDHSLFAQAEDVLR